MSSLKKKDEFIKQAGILATAGIICRVIGILYRSPLTGIIGDEGNGYYSSAYNLYVIILLVSSYSIPSAISKVIAGKLALKEYKNAHRVFKCALMYVIVVGGLASLFTFFCAGFLVQPNSAQVLRIFAPTIFLSGLLGVLRGYFQAHGTMVPTSVSQILEQVFNAVCSIGAAVFFISLAEHASDTSRAIYGASGSAVGTGVGVLTALLFMSVAYLSNKKSIARRLRKDTGHREDSYPEIYLMIIGIVTPIILSTFIYNFSTSLNQTIYARLLYHVKGLAETEIATNYGIFAGKAVVISNIPIALASAMSAAIIPAVSACHARGEKKKMHMEIRDAVHTTMLIAIPSAVGLIALAKPVTALLFPQKATLEEASMLLASIGITVVFYSLSTLTNGVLQAAGKVNLPVLNAAVALVVQTAVLTVLLLYTECNLYALSAAMIVYSLMMCVLNQIAVRKSLGYRQEMVKTFVKPAMAALLMGISAVGVYKGVYYLTSVNTVSLAAAIFTAGVLYFAAVMALGAVTEKDLERLPKGYLLAGLGKKCYLLRDEKYEPPGRKNKKKKKPAAKKRKKDLSGNTVTEKNKAGKTEIKRAGKKSDDKGNDNSGL